MSASLLYHIVKGRLEKGERVDANFILLHNGTTALTGKVLDLALNQNFDTVLTARVGNDVHFCTINQHDADRLHLRPTELGWVIENAPRTEEPEQIEESTATELPIAYDLARNLLKKGKQVYLLYKGKYGTMKGFIHSIDFEERQGLIEMIYHDYYNNDNKTFTDFGTKIFDTFALTHDKESDVWTLKGTADAVE